MQLFSDDDEVEKAFSGENLKMKLKNVEEEVSMLCLTCTSLVLFVCCMLRCIYSVLNSVRYNCWLKDCFGGC